MANQRLDKYIKRILPGCPNSLLYKQLRKKNITLNGKKADGTEIVSEGDSVEVFFSDETFEKFSSNADVDLSRYESAFRDIGNIDAVYEDDDIVVFNKPAGLLSQSEISGKVSVNDYLIGYLLDTGKCSADSLKAFKPSVCNRLDRNTSGLILCSKSLEGAHFLSEKIKSRDIEKYYLALVYGRFDKAFEATAFVCKDEKNNMLEFVSADSFGAVEIKTGFEPMCFNDELSLVKIRLYTGKSHQIRAHLSHLGYPVIGDVKYGNPGKSKITAKRQMLHSYITVLDNEKSFKAPVPEDMKRLLDKYFEKNLEL